MRPRSPFSTKVCWVSARPISQGLPAWVSEVSGEAPVPPSKPEMVTWSARHLATPAATVPTPTSDTSLTEMRALLVDALEVADQLRQVFDGIDVVMRRRRDQADAGRGMAHLGDVGVDLVAGQLAAFAGLGALGHLDLDVVGIDQVFGGDAEAARRHLLDGRTAWTVAIGQRLEAVGFFAALARVGTAADAVHGDGQRGMGLAADRAEAHRAGGEALDDIGRGLDFIQRHAAAAVLKAIKPAQGRAGAHSGR